MTKEQISRYKNPDNDLRGVWQSDNLNPGKVENSLLIMLVQFLGL